MNKTLLHHFDSIGCDKYCKLLIGIEHDLNYLKELLGEKKVKKGINILDALFCKIDYLLVYVKNIVRMGYGSKETNDELNKLYELQDECNRLLDTTIELVLSSPDFCQIDKKYYFYLNEVWESKTIEDETQNDIKVSLEKYQSILNERHFGISLSEIWNIYKEKSKTEFDFSHSKLNSIYGRNISLLNDLYIKIKKYQLEVMKKAGYDNSLEFIAKKYSVDFDSINVMTNNAHIFLFEILSKGNRFDWAPNGVLMELLRNADDDSCTISFEEAIDFLSCIFRELDENFADMVIRAKEDNWIDYSKHDGKMNGSYTNNILYTGESIISMTFENTIRGMCKLAHELGHAYHGFCVYKRGYFCSDFSVITAEAFGLFCENYALVKFIMEKRYFQYKRELYSCVIDTFFVNIKAFLFEYYSFATLRNSGDFDSNMAFKDVLNKIGLKNTSVMEQSEWIFRTQNFFPDYFYYNFVYIMGEAIALKMLLYLLDGKIEFSEVKSILKESGQKNVNLLFDSIGINLHDKELYNVKDELDAIWDCVLNS